MVDGIDPSEAIAAAESQRETQRADAVTAFEWYHGQYEAGAGLIGRGDAVDALMEEHDWERDRAMDAVRGLLDDTLDPVQLVLTGDERHTGIIDYRSYEAEGGYGFIEHDTVRGARKVLVCGKCVEEYEVDSDPWRAVEGVGRHDDECGWDELLDHLTEHYTEEHIGGPDSVEVGASLVSGTSIAGNTAWHSGNDGGGSGLDADTLDSKEPGSLDVDKVDGQDATEIGGGVSISSITTARTQTSFIDTDSATATASFNTTVMTTNFRPVGGFHELEMMPSQHITSWGFALDNGNQARASFSVTVSTTVTIDLEAWAFTS